MPNEDVVPESDEDSLAPGSRPHKAPSPTLTDPDHGPQPSESLTPSTRAKRSRATFEAAPAAGLAAAAASPTKPILKYQPRSDVVRRNKEELEAQRKLEEERRKERIAEADRDRGKDKNTGANNGKGRGVSGRGGGRSGGSILRPDKGREGLASGPLGDGSSLSTKPATNPRGGRFAPGTRQPSQLNKSTTTTVKKEPGAPQTTARPRKSQQRDVAGPKTGVKSSTARQEDAEFADVSSDEDTGQGLRMNIELINLISDAESDEDPIQVRERGMRDRSFTRKTSVKPVFRPVRVDRSDHEVRRVGVNTDASSAISAELRQRSQEKTGDPVDLSGTMDVVNTNAKGKSKEVEFVRNERRWRGVYEDEEEGHPEIKQEPDDIVDVDSAPIAPSSTNDMEVDQSLEGVGVPVDESTMKPKSRRRKITFRDLKGILQTEEDRAEWKRHEEEVESMAEELANMHSGGADAMEEDYDFAAPKLYIFQFPALTPLLNPQSTVETTHLADPEATPIPMPGARESKTPAIKTEFEEPVTVKSISAANAELPGGRVGKLKVHESGRVTLDWGGTSLELGRGSDADFLQDAIAIPRAGDVEETGSTSWALSQIRGKFVVTPDWEKIFS